MPMEQQMSDLPEGRLPIVEHEHFTLFIEFFEGNPFFHLSLEKWSKRIYQELLSMFGEVLSYLKEKGFSAVYVAIPKDDKLLKFENMFGFEILDDTTDNYLLVQEI